MLRTIDNESKLFVSLGVSETTDRDIFILSSYNSWTTSHFDVGEIMLQVKRELLILPVYLMSFLVFIEVNCYANCLHVFCPVLRILISDLTSITWYFYLINNYLTTFKLYYIISGIK